MGWLSRKAGRQDLTTPEAVARFGRFEFLGPDLSGVPDWSSASEPLAPLQWQLCGERSNRATAMGELRRHGSGGEWEAVGAWKYASKFLDGPASFMDLADAAMLALCQMRVTNLRFNLPSFYLERYQIVTGQPPSDDGFFGLPVFDSSFGPTRQYYFDAAISAAAARRPERIEHRAGIEPVDVVDLDHPWWELGTLLLRGPVLSSAEFRSESITIQPAIAMATGVDHYIFVERLAERMVERMAEFAPGGGLTLMGFARFLEDYLDPALAGTAAHARLVDGGLRNLRSAGWIDTNFPVGALSAFERERLDE